MTLTTTELPGALGFQEWMQQTQEQVEAALARRLPAADHEPCRLHEAMRYVALGGGKRVRPLLVYAAGEVSGAAPEHLEAAACALESIHVYSLVHDDMPCMDDDQLRRGRPTCHVAFDEATALLVGDALQSFAFEQLSGAEGIEAGCRLRMVQLLARASGSWGMAGGQAIDLASVGRALTQPELEFMHILKTGALIRAAVLLGALAGPRLTPGEQDALDHFAKEAGLLFQIVDDILDCTASTATLGKTAGKDAADDKPTYVSLLGLSAARSLAREVHERARAALAPLGPRAHRLHALADFIAQRSF